MPSLLSQPTLRQVVDACVTTVGPPLLSVIRHGLVPERRREPFHLLLLVEPADVTVLHALGTAIQRFHRQLLVEPVIFTPHELLDSIDVFPLEFVQMQLLPYDVLHGLDVLRDVSVKPHDLRTQLHEDLKTKRLWLRQSLVYLVRQPRRVAELPIQAFPNLLPVLRGALHLHGKPVPVPQDQLLTAAAAAFSLDADLLLTLGSGRPPAQEAETLLQRYLAVLDRLVEGIGQDGPAQ
jgi:hypothetical protein